MESDRVSYSPGYLVRSCMCCVFEGVWGGLFPQLVAICRTIDFEHPWLASVALIQSLISTEKKFASPFSFTYSYIDDLLVIKYTKKSNTSAFYFDILLSMERDGQIDNSLYDNETISISTLYNISSSPAIDVFFSKLIGYARFANLMSKKELPRDVRNSKSPETLHIQE